MSDLQAELQDLIKQRDALNDKLRCIPKSGNEQFLNAIKNQRWFLFKNKPDIIFDRDTALLWADLKSFPYEPSQQNGRYQLSEIQSLIDITNINGIDGYKNWKIPTPYELWKIVEDKTFPYCGGPCWRIKDCWHWCVYYHVQYRSKDLDYSGETSGLGFNSVFVIPCNAELHPIGYETYLPEEKFRKTLDIFITHNLEPIFSDSNLTELFRQIYVIKSELQTAFDALQQKILAVQAKIDTKIKDEEEKNLKRFDSNILIKKFDIGTQYTQIRYALAVKTLTEYLTIQFDDLVAEKADVLAELNRLSVSPALVPNVKKVRAELNNFHADALNIYERLMHTENLQDLNSANEKIYPPFMLITETLVLKIRKVILKVEIFEKMPNFIRAVCEPIRTTLSSGHHEKIRTSDRKTRKVILDLIEYVQKNHLRKKLGDTTAAELALKIFQAYRKSLQILSEEKKFKIDNEDIKARVEVLKRNMKELAEKLEDESEKLWLYSKCVEVFDF